jgi:chemosensory pili system protein ChpA (sensor histidine kinase/response regulator)
MRHQARQTARELGKEVELQMKGGEVEIDRKVLDGISEALDHMIRNALDHGIEGPTHREDLGKPGSGTILIECVQKGNNAVIRFGDDGAGLGIEQIRDKAIAQGLIKQDAEISDQEIIQLIVLPGFTTATKVTQLSGRGVGMDVVHNAVRRLGGSITVDSRQGEGTVFEIILPLSLSITQAIFVRCGQQEFAISLNVIQNVMKVDADELNFPSVGGQTQFEKDGRVYPLIDLPRRFGLASGDGKKQRVAILIIRMGAREVAVRVSELLTTQEVVVKSLGRHMSRIEGISGATIRGDGSVVIILDLAALWVADERHGVTDAATQELTQRSPIVMVVDDSLTVRKVTARNLSRHGMEVVMAKDGVDAIERMGKRLPDLMLVDIEMPRMDGYQLTEHVRNDPIKKGIPIVIITSRAGIRHKEKAMALGANGYLTKPYQEEELIASVRDCLQSFPSNSADP